MLRPPIQLRAFGGTIDAVYHEQLAAGKHNVIFGRGLVYVDYQAGASQHNLAQKLMIQESVFIPINATVSLRSLIYSVNRHVIEALLLGPRVFSRIHQSGPLVRGQTSVWPTWRSYQVRSLSF